jgi:hypothetical protein
VMSRWRQASSGNERKAIAAIASSVSSVPAARGG